MKYFIRHTVFFVLAFFMLFVLFEAATSRIIDRKADFRLDQESPYLLLGHSARG